MASLRRVYVTQVASTFPTLETLFESSSDGRTSGSVVQVAAVAFLPAPWRVSSVYFEGTGGHRGKAP
jgi:hypothetical protein